jgi:hypothetical protein
MVQLLWKNSLVIFIKLNINLPFHPATAILDIYPNERKIFTCPLYTFGGMLISTVIMKTVQGFLKKLKIRLPYDPAVPLLDMYPTEIKSLQRDVCTTRCTAALFIITQKWR